MQFTIKGQIIPYVRMTRRGKYVSDRAQRYLSSKDAIGYQYRQQMAQNDWQAFGKEPLQVEIRFTIAGSIRKSDLDNLVKSVIDAGNKIVWFDDRYIDKIVASRKQGDRYLVALKVERIT